MQSKQDRLLVTIIFFLVTKRLRFIKYQGAKLWNSISNEIKKSASVKLFKKTTKRSY